MFYGFFPFSSTNVGYFTQYDSMEWYCELYSSGPCFNRMKLEKPCGITLWSAFYKLFQFL